MRDPAEAPKGHADGHERDRGSTSMTTLMTALRYQVVYLSAGARETAQVEARDAAAAVAAVSAAQRQRPASFELLSVVPTGYRRPAAAPRAAERGGPGMVERDGPDRPSPPLASGAARAGR